MIDYFLIDTLHFFISRLQLEPSERPMLTLSLACSVLLCVVIALVDVAIPSTARSCVIQHG